MSKLLLAILMVFSFSTQATDYEEADFDKKVASLSLSIKALSFEYCNCRFVMEQEKKFCDEFVFGDIPLPRKAFFVKENKKKSTIRISSALSVGILGSKIKYSESNGCQY